jgi:hypothetical protein
MTVLVNVGEGEIAIVFERGEGETLFRAMPDDGPSRDWLAARCPPSKEAGDERFMVHPQVMLKLINELVQR